MKFFAITLIAFLYCSISLAEKIDVQFSKGKWEVLSYSKIPANQVSFTDGKMNIKVSSSASPLIYPMSEPTPVKSVSFEAKVNGSIDLHEKKQGDKGADDFLLRIGLVYEGSETLGFFKRQVAADWVKRLFKLAPEGTGVEKIDFYNVYSDPKLSGGSRKHPLSDLIEEHFITAKPEDGMIKASFKVPQGKKVLALWISSDGDDTNSEFEVELSKIDLHLKEPAQTAKSEEETSSEPESKE